MSHSINTVTLLGRLGANPEIRYFESGKNKTTFTLAVGKGKDKKPNWYRCEAWGKTALTAAEYLVKGKQIVATGELAMDHWVDEEGDERITPIINIQMFHFTGSRNEEND